MSRISRCFASLRVQPALAGFIVIVGCGGGGAGDPTSAGSSTNAGTAETAGFESGTGEPTGDVAETRPCSQEVSFLTLIGDNFALVVGDVDGSEPSHVMELLPEVRDYSWSPDGSRFVYSARSSEAWSTSVDLYLGDLMGGSEPLVVLEGQDEFPEWAPVGDTIAFIRAAKEDNLSRKDLWTIDAKTGVQTRLRVEGAFAVAFSWSPNADAIALAVDGYKGAVVTSLLRVPVGGGEPEVLVKEEEGMRELTNPVWAPDGATIAFSGRMDTYLQGYTIPAAGGAVQRVTEGPAYNLAWSPDASTLVYRGWSNTSFYGLFTVVPGSGLEVELVPDIECWRPRWCDGSDVIVSDCRTNYVDHSIQRILMIDTKGVIQEITSPGVDVRKPRWRPNVP